MKIVHPLFFNAPMASIALFAILLIVQQRHYVLEYNQQQRINKEKLKEAVALMNF
tara:strand:- start:1165 stop:1329 length:165 start_codon:yes stop_codon:yes gene_type:complete